MRLFGSIFLAAFTGLYAQTQPTLSVVSTPPTFMSEHIVMGSSVTLLQWTVVNNAGIAVPLFGPVAIVDATTSHQPGFSNLTLWVNGAQVDQFRPASNALGAFYSYVTGVNGARSIPAHASFTIAV